MSSYLAIIVAEDWIEHVILSVSFLSDHFRAAKRIESVIAGPISAHKLPIGQSIHRLGGAEADLAIINGVSCGTLVAHRVWIAHIQSCAVGHEARHGLHRHARLIQAGEGCDFDLWLQNGVCLEAESRGGCVTNVPEVITSIHYLHVDPLTRLLVRDILVLLFKPIN